MKVSTKDIEMVAIEFIQQIVWSYDRHGPCVYDSPRNNIDEWLNTHYPEFIEHRFEVIKSVRRNWDTHKRVGVAR
ncbi:hypothetical protein [Alicyclobacillus suci]|uniref:hypothetical protein n=1 Tax=Alicyclobacillus suci TaxID=2816080 RepID=UPI001A8FC573|nr:hypothetical protein [Alicyclobacillus suci]